MITGASCRRVRKKRKRMIAWKKNVTLSNKGFYQEGGEEFLLYLLKRGKPGLGVGVELEKTATREANGRT